MAEQEMLLDTATIRAAVAGELWAKQKVIEHYYLDLLTRCRDFLSSSGGSSLPPNMAKVELYYTLPIFLPLSSITISHKQQDFTFDLKLIGSGSYANVYKYKDTFYNRPFILKRAKKELTDKEVARFKREFDVMNDLSSPYILEVYCYNPDKNEYIMEYMDYTLDGYIAAHKRRIDKVKQSDAKCWLIKLQQDGRGYSSIHSIRGVVRPAFQMAVDDDLIRKNPFEFQLATVVVNDSVTREAITRKQERAFLEFVASDKHFCKYYDGIYILFKTGLRISEFVGLTLADVDMKNRKININHQLQRKRNMEYIIEDTKTSSGTRVIPMTDDVYECFKRIIANRKKPKVEPMICGKSGFLYLDKNDMPMVALHWEKYFQHICEKYNSIYKVQMPKITPHVCRHTFCSNMAKSGMNPKTLQYIMGHSDIGVTLNTYTHIGFEDAQEELQRVANAE